MTPSFWGRGSISNLDNSIEMPIFVMNLKPFLRCIIPGILGKKYLGLFKSLLSLLKSLTHLTLPSFESMVNVGKAHSLLGTCWSTSILMRCWSLAWKLPCGFELQDMVCRRYVWFLHPLIVRKIGLHCNCQVDQRIILGSVGVVGSTIVVGGKISECIFLLLHQGKLSHT